MSKAHDAILTAKKYAEIRNNTYDVLLNLIQLGDLENKRNNLEKSVQYFKEFENLYAKEGEDAPSFGADISLHTLMVCISTSTRYFS